MVLFAICTDGGENASVEFKKEQIKEMIQHQQKKYNWRFSFLGANQDAFAEASSLGIKEVGTANYTNTFNAYSSTGAKFSRMRSASLSGREINNSYTEEELVSMVKE